MNEKNPIDMSGSQKPEQEVMNRAKLERSIINKTEDLLPKLGTQAGEIIKAYGSEYPEKYMAKVTIKINEELELEVRGYLQKGNIRNGYSSKDIPLKINGAEVFINELSDEMLEFIEAKLTDMAQPYVDLAENDKRQKEEDEEKNKIANAKKIEAEAEIKAGILEKMKNAIKK